MIMGPIRGKSPEIGEGTFVAPSADIIGDVKIGKRCSIWFNTTLRGDVMPIEIGDETNIQDNTVIHGTFKKCGAKIGKRVTVGHSVILHGCEIGDNVLIGMGAVIMDLVKIPKNCFVAAGALVTEESSFEEGMMIMGRPAVAKRPLKPNELAFLSKSADNYMEYMSWYENQGGSNDF